MSAIRTTLLAVAWPFVLAGCATPMQQSDAPMTRYDRDSEYAVTPRDGGFTIAINYSRYQFIPESTALATACRSALTAIAYEYAEKQGRKIQPINEQRVRISMGRNGFTGITSCSASAVADWQT
jgi:hypothetical protein